MSLNTQVLNIPACKANRKYILQLTEDGTNNVPWATMRHTLHMAGFDGDDLPSRSGTEQKAPSSQLPTTTVGLMFYLERLGVIQSVVEPTAKDQRIIDGLRLVEDQQKRALKDKDETIARLAIRNEKLARHLEATELDKRTMLPNYEVVSSMLANAIHQEKRGDGFAVVFMDAFRFKLYNEHWSYALGNIVLLNLGQILRHELRDAFIGRWGGEEFVGILYSLRDEKSAAVALWRLMHAIENYGWIGVDQRLAAHPPRLNMGALFCPIPTPETRLHLAERTAQVAGAVIEISSLLMKQAKQEMRESRPSVVVTSSLDSLHWTGVPSSTEIKAEGESWQNRALSRLLNLASPPTLWTATDVEPKALS